MAWVRLRHSVRIVRMLLSGRVEQPSLQSTVHSKYEATSLFSAGCSGRFFTVRRRLALSSSHPPDHRVLPTGRPYTRR